MTATAAATVLPLPLPPPRPAAPGDVVGLGGRVAYVAQTAWVLNASLADNVTLGAPLEEARWSEVVQVGGTAGGTVVQVGLWCRWVGQVGWSATEATGLC